MNYKQLTDKKKAQIDILLATSYSMRAAAKILNISHSTISRYKIMFIKKEKIKCYDESFIVKYGKQNSFTN